MKFDALLRLIDFHECRSGIIVGSTQRTVGELVGLASRQAGFIALGHDFAYGKVPFEFCQGLSPSGNLLQSSWGMSLSGRCRLSRRRSAAGAQTSLVQLTTFARKLPWGVMGIALLPRATPCGCP